MVTIFNIDGEPLGTSRNLRGLIDRNRKFRHAEAAIDVRELSDGGANFSIVWADDSWVSTDFADYGVCVDFANAKRFSNAAKNFYPKA